jgi:hypothetical protein
METHPSVLSRNASIYSLFAWVGVVIGGGFAPLPFFLCLQDVGASQRYIHAVAPQRLPWLYRGLAATLIAFLCVGYLHRQSRKQGQADSGWSQGIWVYLSVVAALLLWITLNPNGYLGDPYGEFRGH